MSKEYTEVPHKDEISVKLRYAGYDSQKPMWEVKAIVVPPWWDDAPGRGRHPNLWIFLSTSEPHLIWRGQSLNNGQSLERSTECSVANLNLNNQALFIFWSLIMLTFYYAKLLIQLHNVKKKVFGTIYIYESGWKGKKKKNQKEFAEEDSQAVLRCSVESWAGHPGSWLPTPVCVRKLGADQGFSAAEKAKLSYQQTGA